MRATARICGAGINTVVRLLREIGPVADRYHHENVRGIVSRRVQLDEVWTFIAAKAKHAKMAGHRDAGDLWTWTALDPDTKLLISDLCGPRTGRAALAFMMDVKRRLAEVPHFASDGLVSHEEAI